MAISVEMWQPIIKEELYSSNAFLQHLKNADEYVVGGKIVHIPQSGGPANVERNRSVFPATTRRRIDTDVTYVLDDFSTDPDHIHDAEKVELSYVKTQSVIRENTGFMMQEAGDWTIYNSLRNATAAQVIETTGVAAAASASDATGDRKILTRADLRRAKVMLNKQNVPRAGRYLLLSSEMIDHLAADKDLVYAFQKTYDLKTGVIAEIEGFMLLERSKVINIAADGTIKTPDAATAVDDNDAAFFWQTDFVEKALGDYTMYDNYGRAEYYGDIFSFRLRLGGRACRADQKGYGIIQRATV